MNGSQQQQQQQPDDGRSSKKRARQSESPPRASSSSSTTATTAIGRGYGSGKGTYLSSATKGSAETAEQAQGARQSPGNGISTITDKDGSTSSASSAQQEQQQADNSDGVTHVRNAALVNRNQEPLSRDNLEPSFFLLEPHDEFTREVGDWIWNWCSNRADVEIEAKIGVLVDNRPGLPPKTRVSFPLATETILTDTTFARFESNMTLRQHHHFNTILNMRAEEAARPEYTGAPIRYVHTREIDAFYDPGRSSSSSSHNNDSSSSSSGGGSGGGGGGGRQKIRVTRDERTGQVKAGGKACIRKSRVADMNVFSPKRSFDFRISISVEQSVDMPTTQPTHTRRKDRVSYQHQAMTIDLTQVKRSDSKEVMHELEIELSDMPLLMREGQKAAQNQDNIYYDLVQVFLNNIRMLIRNAVPP